LIGGAPFHVKRKLNAYLMLLPAIIYFILFVYYPVFNLFKLSFFKYDLFREPEFVGMVNFIKLVRDKDFLSALGNTIYFSFFTTLFSVAISFFLAIIIERSTRMANFYKVVYFIPYISPAVAVALIWQWLYHPGETGLLNYFISFWGIPPQSWHHDPQLAMPSLIVISIWQGLGYRIVIFIAGLKAIPRQYHEAAEVDGANAWQRIKYVTFPCLKPVFQFVLIITTLQTFRIFTPMYILTAGGPVGKTTTIVYSLYKQAFQFSKWGYAAAQAIVLFVFLLILSFIQRRMTRS